MSALAWVGFLAAAGVGAAGRFAVDDSVRRRFGTDVPWGILLVNVAGCLLLGVVAGVDLYRGLSSDMVTVVGAGGVGAFTTFSTFTVEVVRLAQTGQTRRAAGYLVATLALGLAAVAGGLGLIGLSA